MNFLALLPIFTTLIDRIFPDKTKQDEAKAELMKIMATADAQKMTAQANVIVAEAKGESWMQRNARPSLMFIGIAILTVNYLVAPILGSVGLHVETLPLPEHLWTLLDIGMGGYIVGRSVENVASHFSDTKFFNSLRSKLGGLSKKEVDAINAALADAKKE